MERQRLLSSLTGPRHGNVHEPAAGEGLLHAEWECTRRERGETGRTVLMLFASPSFSSALPLHFHTQTLKHTCEQDEGTLPLAAIAARR